MASLSVQSLAAALPTVSEAKPISKTHVALLHALPTMAADQLRLIAEYTNDDPVAIAQGNTRILAEMDAVFTNITALLKSVGNHRTAEVHNRCLAELAKLHHLPSRDPFGYALGTFLGPYNQNRVDPDRTLLYPEYFEELQREKPFTAIDFGSAPLSTTQIESLKRLFPLLQRLVVTDSTIQQIGQIAVKFAQLTHLEVSSISYTREPTAMRFAAQLRNTNTHQGLRAQHDDRTSILFLKQLKHLETLSLRFSVPHPGNLCEVIAALPHLQDLTLITYSPLTLEELQTLAGCKALTRLRLHLDSVDNVPHLSLFARLEQLDLTLPGSSDPSFLRKLPLLRTLRLRFFNHQARADSKPQPLRDNTLTTLVNSTQHVTNLQLLFDDMLGITDEGIQQLRERGNAITELSLQLINIRDYSFLGALHALETLYLGHRCLINDEQLALLSRAPWLRQLTLGQLPNVTRAGILQLREAPNLKTVTFYEETINLQSYQKRVE